MKKLLTFLAVATVAAIVVLAFRTEPKEKTPEEKAQIEAEKTANERSKKIDFALTGLKEMIKDKMKDPDSYEVITREYDHRDKGDTVSLYIKFRGNNSFGGKAVTSVWANYYVKDDWVEITKQKQE